MNGRHLLRRAILPLLAALLVACSTEDRAPEPGTIRDARSARPLEIAKGLARVEPPLFRALETSALIQDPYGAATPLSAVDPFVRLPDAASGVVELRAGARSRVLATVRSLGAPDSPLELSSGVAVYRRAVEGADALWLMRGNAVEELLLVQTESPAVRFSWELCPSEEASEVRVEHERGLVFSDEQGTDRLRVPEPFALDGRGTRRAMRMAWTSIDPSCGQIEFSLDTRGLDFPLLVDPALEAVWWTEKARAAPSPSPRFFHGLAYDAARSVTVLFGGTSNGFTPSLGDTWEWDGAAWEDVTPASSSIEPRMAHDLAYSPAHGGALLFGGFVEDATGVHARADTWRWNGTAWSAPPGITGVPPAAGGHALAFDSQRSVAVMYGGWGDSGANLDVWELGLTAWTNRGRRAPTPGSIDFFAFAYDARAGHVLLFGGSSPAGVLDPAAAVAGTWTWNGAAWSELGAAGPSARSGVAVAYDSKRGRTVIFGGTDVNGFDTNETWEFDGTAWELRVPLLSPFARSNTRLAYDVARDRVVLFGGYTFNGEGDTWEYAHFGNTCSSDAGCDGYPCLDGVCCNAPACGVCEACSAESGECEPLLSAEDPNGGCSDTRTCSASGVCLAKPGQACNAAAACASGYCMDGVCCDRACGGACESCAQQGRAGTCTFVTGPAARGTCPGAGPCGARCGGTGAECEFPASGEACGATCAEGARSGSTCDGRGACIAAPPESCPGRFACETAETCRTGCTVASHCAPGLVCRGGTCTESTPTCIDAVTAEGPGGREDCGAYACEAGKCRTTCERAADCAPERVCNLDGQCISGGSIPGSGGAAGLGGGSGEGGDSRDGGRGDGAREAGENDSCACRLSQRDTEGGRGVILLGLAAALFGQRRRRS